MLSRRAALGTFAAPVLCSRMPGQSKMFADAEAYQRFMGRWSTLLAPLLVDFSNIRDGGRILDVGSGTGALAFAVARLRSHCQVLGIDPSQQYVAYAGSKNPAPDRVRFETGDAQQLQFPNAAFDASVSLLVFNFIPDAKKALREVTRVTKPGGTVSAAVWDYGEGMRMLRVFWDAAGAIDPSGKQLDEAHMPLCRSGELAALWKDGGLEQVSERPIEITTRFQSFDDYWSPFLLGQGPAGAFVQKLRSDARQAMRADTMRRLKLPSGDAPFSLPARAWAVRGTVPGRS